MEAYDLNVHLLIWINQHWSNPVFDVFFTWLSMKAGFSIPLLTGITVYCTWRYGKRGLWFSLLVILLTLFTDFVGNQLKHLFLMPRPCLEFGHILHVPFRGDFSCETSTDGMPSNHAMNFFSVMTFISLFFPRRWIVISCYTIATLVGLSRIYLAAHFPLEVLAGAIFGIILGWLFAMFIRKIWPDLKFNENTSLRAIR